MDELLIESVGRPILEAKADDDGMLRGSIALLEVDALTMNATIYSRECWEGFKSQVSSLLESDDPERVKVLTMFPGHFPFTSPETANPVLSIAGRITGCFEQAGQGGGGTVGFIRFEVPPTTVGRDIQTLLKGGFLSGISLRAAKPLSETVRVGAGRTAKRIRSAQLLGADWCNDPSMRFSRGNLSQAQLSLLESIQPSPSRCVEPPSRADLLMARIEELRGDPNATAPTTSKPLTESKSPEPGPQAAALMESIEDGIGALQGVRVTGSPGRLLEQAPRPKRLADAVGELRDATHRTG